MKVATMALMMITASPIGYSTSRVSRLMVSDGASTRGRRRRTWERHSGTSWATEEALRFRRRVGAAAVPTDPAGME